jgi:dethiobiotin synthetase
MHPIFITGIGTEIGKTIVAAIVAEALHADYWKPIQAGFSTGTDNLVVKNLLSNSTSIVHDELYKLKLAASPHIAAREENIEIDLREIKEKYLKIIQQDSHLTTQVSPLIIEGAGGILVPLNENEFVVNLIKMLDAKVILVSRNYLGSINHSLLTAEICKAKNIDVIGWIFNDQYLNYEDEIVHWSGFRKIDSIPFAEKIGKKFVSVHAEKMREKLISIL